MSGDGNGPRVGSGKLRVVGREEKRPVASGKVKRERWMSDMDPPRIEILVASEKMARRAAALLESDDPSALEAAAKLLYSASGGLEVASRALLSDNWRLTMVPTMVEEDADGCSESKNQ